MSQCKRLLSVTLACLLICLMLSAGITVLAHTDNVDFGVTATNGNVGDTITVNVTLSEKSYFTNCTTYLCYDSSKVQYVSDELGDAAPNGAMYATNNMAEKGYVKVAFVAIKGITKGGNLLTFQFKVLNSGSASFSLRMDECVGVEANDQEFNLVYTLHGCVANDDGSSVETVVTSPKATTTKNQSNATTPVTPQTNAGSQSTAGEGDNIATVAPPTSIVTIPVTVTNAAGQPVTDAQGQVETTFITSSITVTTTAAIGGEIAATTASGSTPPDSTSSGGNTGWILLVVGIAAALIALGVAGFALMKKRKGEEPKPSETEETTPAEPSEQSDETAADDQPDSADDTDLSE